VALWQKVEKYRPYLKGVAGKILGQQGKLLAREDSSDVVQKALERGYADRATFKGETAEEFQGWLVRIVQNVALNTLRGGQRKKRDVRREAALPADGDAGPQLSAGTSTPSQKAARTEEVVRLLAAVEGLPEREQEVVRLHAFEALSYEGVAEKLGTTKEKVRGAWERAIAMLRAGLRARP
jgi:RNA polymerase sigma-70 factor (ECF subfamily)